MKLSVIINVSVNVEHLLWSGHKVTVISNCGMFVTLFAVFFFLAGTFFSIVPYLLCYSSKPLEKTLYNKDCNI